MPASASASYTPGLVGAERTSALQNQGDGLKGKMSIQCGKLRSDVNIHGMVPFFFIRQAILQRVRKTFSCFGADVRVFYPRFSAVGDGRIARTSVLSLRPRPRPGRIRFRVPSSRATERTR